MEKIVIKIGLSISLCFYLMILTWMVLFKYLTIPEIISHFTFSYDGPYWNIHNFVPFKTIIYYLFLANEINTNIRVENLAGNIIGFIPFGVILPLLSRKFMSLKKVMLATFCLSFMFECMQLIFRFGSFDVDDLMLNTLGGIVGYLFVKVVVNSVETRRNTTEQYRES